MRSKEKQAGLDKHKAVLLFTLDYLNKRYGRSFVVDGNSSIQDYYGQQKLQTEKYYHQRRLDRMQQQLRRLAESLRNHADLHFCTLVNESTGYDLDIFAETRSHVEAILLQNQINTDKERNDVNLILRLYEQTTAEPEKEKLLKNLLNDFYKRTYHSASSPRKQKGVKCEIVEKTINDGIEKVTVSFSTGPKAAHFNEKIAISPNGKRHLRVTEWSGDGINYSTSVSIHFPGVSGPVYGVHGLYPNINAVWKDNNTIIIEVPKNVVANLYSSTVESFDDRISIEYVMT